MKAFDNAIQKPFAVVTGASSGIGLALARQFVAHGFDLLVAADEALIFDVAAELQGTAEIFPVRVDTKKKEGVEVLWRHLEKIGRPVEALAISVPAGTDGPFIAGDVEADLDMISRNIGAPTMLAKFAAREMQARGRGKILIAAGIASVMPTPFQAVCGASAAYLLSLAEALRAEMQDSGVTVTALVQAAGDPEGMARAGFRAMMEGRDHAVSQAAQAAVQEWASVFRQEGGGDAQSQH